MKILLTALNAKFVHTSLANWCLYRFCRPEFPDLAFREFNINQEPAWVAGEIYLEKADVAAFSCNIWNIGQTLLIVKRLKAVAPRTVIILGGPEVWFNPREIMAQNPEIDFIIVGEGELTFKEWLAHYYSGRNDWAAIKGLVHRTPAGPAQNESRPEIADLSILPFPYPDDLTGFQKKLLYYETSRGCPYHCQYCLSANERGVRFFPIERVKRDLLRFIDQRVAQVKLVDRSFNCNPRWAKEIWKFLLEHPGVTNFHFEIVGDLLDAESIAILAQAPPGLFQFEIGVQSTNPATLRSVRRQMDFSRLARRVGELVNQTQVFVHLDLIAGLPEEDYPTFSRSFNDNLALRPRRLQLGFLKLLKGSGLRARAEEYGYRFTGETPYEVLASRWISYEELLRLKTVEDLLERYYNSGRFSLSLAYLMPRFASPFQFFESFGGWWKRQNFDQFAHKNKDLYEYLLRFYEETGGDAGTLRELLKFDLLSQERNTDLPAWAASNDSGLKEFSYAFFKEPAHIQKYLPETAGEPLREILRRVLFAGFKVNPLAISKEPAREPKPSPTVILFVYGSGRTKTYQVAAGGGKQ